MRPSTLNAVGTNLNTNTIFINNSSAIKAYTVVNRMLFVSCIDSTIVPTIGEDFTFC